MSYLVLARKWRPKDFSEVTGQEHVLRALINALDEDRIHHAFLFSGMRGVGKTTLARILAKAINCDEGVSSTPCGVCWACQEIDEGRFVDLIEVDAASRTRVDDTRELLDNVQYAPTRGRYKVYLIDEVHMLSTHSFNALLKTLEEPPPHVKFLLATTDPQKLPVTVLSRCLQFNLKRLSPPLIEGRLNRILEAEEVPSEAAAVRLIGRAADGSMRDALSLLDQCIAYGGGKLVQAEVSDLLGTVDQQHVVSMLEAIANRDGEALMGHVSRFDERGLDYPAVLDELATALQRVALAQVVPGALEDRVDDVEAIRGLAQQFGPEEAQLCYQIALIGRRDLPLASDQRGGFEMILLRMLAFQPAAPAGGDVRRATSNASGPARQPGGASASAQAVPPERNEGGNISATEQRSAARAPVVASGPTPQRTLSDWSQVVAGLDAGGAARQLAANCVVQRREGEALHLQLEPAHEHLLTRQLQERLQEAISGWLGERISLHFHVTAPAVETPAQKRVRLDRQRVQAAHESLEHDPNVRALKEALGATVQPESVVPLNRENP